MQSKAYAQANPNRGRFRSFLLASLKNYLSDVWHRNHALKRGGEFQFVLFHHDVEAAEVLFANSSTDTSLDEEERYERRWAESLLACALTRLATDFAAEPKARLFHGLKPFLTGGHLVPDQAETAAQMEMPVETLRSHISRLRARHRALLREEVANTITSADDLDEEVRHIFGVLVVHT